MIKPGQRKVYYEGPTPPMSSFRPHKLHTIFEDYYRLYENGWCELVQEKVLDSNGEATGNFRYIAIGKLN